MDEYISKHEAYTMMKDLEAAYIYPPVEEAYGTAARRIDQMPSADVQPVDRWINVKNNLPEEAAKVLIYTEYNVIAYGFFTGAYYNNRPLFAMTINRNSKRSWYEEIRVSHWMSLPKPPKDGDTNG